MQNNDLYKRLARAEAAAAQQNAELMETLRDGYERACEAQDEESAAEFCRKIRNKLLEQSDAEMSLDRLGLTVPSGTTFTAWLSFLKGLGSALTGAWSTYRQALRDLTAQPGFPFDVTFPEKPE